MWWLGQPIFPRALRIDAIGTLRVGIIAVIVVREVANEFNLSEFDPARNAGVHCFTYR